MKLLLKLNMFSYHSYSEDCEGVCANFGWVDGAKYVSVCGGEQACGLPGVLLVKGSVGTCRAEPWCSQ